jgi:nitrite reductase/ring-hydroxylating ferredoxin subunit
MADFVRAAATADIPDDKGRLWRHGDKRIALFRTPAGVYAADNRCPHEGYALKDGDIRGDVLTCAWHNWKFRITDGACLFGGENIRTYPTSIREGWVYVDVTDPAPEQIAPELFASLLAAMGDADTGRLARDTMRLNAIGMPLTEVVRTGVTYGATRAEYGWNHSLATLADCLTMIMVAHAVKTTTAAITESAAGGRAPLAAAARFLAAPKRERFVYQATLDAIDFIQGRAKGDTPE